MNELSTLISFQEKLKSNTYESTQTLIERMCIIAEPIIKHNWNDVAIHDARLLKRMNPGEVRLWMIYETGSCFWPLYCKMDEYRKQERDEYTLSSVEVAVGRLLSNSPLNMLRSKFVLSTAEFYIVTKDVDEYGGSIESIAFTDVVDLLYSGKANHLT